MFSIDFPEIIIIFGVALVVLGPKKLPGAAAKIGRWVGRARSMARQFREQLEQEVASAENAIDIRKEVDSAAEPTIKQPSRDAGAAAQAGSTPSADAHSAHTPQPEGVPPAAAAHESPSHEGAPGEGPPHEAMPYEPTPYHSMPEHTMPPPEGYGPVPQQLSFGEQLHDTALPPGDEHATHARDWMPETQTWMANQGWEVPEPSAGGNARSSAGSGPAPASPGSGEDTAKHQDETVEHHDR